MKKKLIKFILSFTDYDKVKKENDKLKSDISTLIDDPYSIESYVITESYKMEKQISKMLWMGDIGVRVSGFEGIVKHIVL